MGARNVKKRRMISASPYAEIDINYIRHMGYTEREERVIKLTRHDAITYFNHCKLCAGDLIVLVDGPRGSDCAYYRLLDTDIDDFHYKLLLLRPMDEREYYQWEGDLECYNRMSLAAQAALRSTQGKTGKGIDAFSYYTLLEMEGQRDVMEGRRAALENELAQKRAALSPEQREEIKQHRLQSQEKFISSHKGMAQKLQLLQKYKK